MWLDICSQICNYNATLPQSLPAKSLTIITREHDRLILQITTKGDDFLSNSSGFDRQCRSVSIETLLRTLVTSTIEMRITVCRHHCYGPG
jgi:hypothetical protein